MRTLPALRALGNIDLRNVRRDPMLLWLTAVPVMMALAMRFGIPVLTETLRRRAGFDLAPYSPLILSFVALTMPSLVGAVIAFMLLDQRDDGTLSALQVTPLTLHGYLAYRSTVPVVVSFLMTAVAMPLSGLTSGGALPILLGAAVAAPLAPLFALFVASFAANKVQGFALMKGSGVLAWPALVAWFVQPPWQVLFGAVPHYWIAKVVWLAEAGEPGAWLHAAVALAFQGVLLVVLLRRFERVVHR